MVRGCILRELWGPPTPLAEPRQRESGLSEFPRIPFPAPSPILYTPFLLHLVGGGKNPTSSHSVQEFALPFS